MNGYNYAVQGNARFVVRETFDILEIFKNFQCFYPCIEYLFLQKYIYLHRFIQIL